MESYPRPKNGQSKFEEIKNASKPAAKVVYRDGERYGLAKQKLRSLETERIGREKYYKLRDQWSWFLRFLLTVMVLFQFLVTGAIGLEIVNFSEYKNFLYAILVENFLQIVGMAVIVVTFLFPGDRSEKEEVKRYVDKNLP